MAVLWVIFILTSSGLHLVHGLPINPSSRIYPQEASGLSVLERWTAEGGLYAALPALALVFAAFGLLFGCTWCYRHKDCKIFTASVTHLNDARRSQPPDSGFSEPVNNNISEDNNNGPISLREMQNIANNNAAAYIVSENEERNRISRESVVEFEPLPTGIGVIDPLERCADWFAGEDLPRDHLQYLREIGRGWFGRVVKGEIEDGDSTTTVAVKILNQNASLEDKARFLDEARLYRNLSHENILMFIAKCLQEDPWLLIFELCPMDLQQYIATNRPQMEVLNESGVPLQLMCDITSALAYLHSRGYVYRNLWSGNVLVRCGDSPRAALGQYAPREPPHQLSAPETSRHHHRYAAPSDVWALGHVIWELCAWAPPSQPPAHHSPPAHHTPPPPPSHTVYGNHLYQVMQLCWNTNPEARPSAAQVHALVEHLLTAHARASDASNDDGYGSSDFEERWQRLKPNTIPKIDEHVAIVHAPSTSMASHFTGSDQEFDNAPTLQDSLSVEMDTAVSRSSSIMSDRDPLSVQAKSDSLTNLHGSLEDVRNIYLTHNETATLECHQGNIALEEVREREHDRSNSSVDPWLKDIITDSQDDVSYYKDVSDVIKNLDNILNSEKTSSSESSHQASPSRDNLSLECKKESPLQTSMVKSPGISNFKNILEMGFDSKSETAKDCEDDEGDADTIGTLSHSFERHSDTTSQQTLENITPETPIKDLDILNRISETEAISEVEQKLNLNSETELKSSKDDSNADTSVDYSNYGIPKLKELCVVSMPSISKTIEDVIEIKDCQKPYSNNIVSNDNTETKSIENKIDLSNGTENITNGDNKSDQNEVTSNEYEEETNRLIAGDIKTLKDIKSEVDTYIEDQSDINDCNEDTKDKILDYIKQHNSLISPEAVKNSSTLECIENKVEPSNITKSESTELVTTSETNLTQDLICTSQNLELNSEKLNLTNTGEENRVASKTFIINEITENQNINDKLENRNSSNSSPTSHSNETHSPKQSIKNNLPNSFHNNVDTEASIREIKNQENVTDVSEKNYQDKIFDSVSSSIANLSQQSDIQVQKIDENTSQNINESFKENESPSVINITSQAAVDVPNNIIINETFVVDKNKALGFNDCSLKQASTELPETVQILTNSAPLEVNHLEDNEKEIVKETPLLSQSIKPENQVQNIYPDDASNLVVHHMPLEEIDRISDGCKPTSDIVAETAAEHSSDSTIYMDLSDSKNDEKLKDNIITNANDIIKVPEASTTITDINSSLNESTVYLDLPNVIKEINIFLHSEKIVSSQSVDFEDNVLTSTPKGSENSGSTLEPPEEETTSHTKVPAEAVGDTFVKSKNASDNLSPFESPTKSHHTDTYDENSSVVLGSLENCIFESLKTVKSEVVDIPKEELLAFSSNFSEINLETPSPLRDGNFLNEVPDIVSDELHFDGIENMNEAKVIEPVTENTTESEELSSTKRVSPSTPPNSPGNFLASTSQMKYLVDIDINNADPTTGNNIEETVHLNQIELQMTTKMAMAENENNMNIEYSGPLVVEQEDSPMVLDNVPEAILAGNVASVDYQKEALAIDEERMKELRNELELKLPLAQVSGIEPAEWCPPPPPELLLAYGALSPIAEETRLQLSAYENDDHWNLSVRTDSSESYPEPCNNSTDEVTDLPTGLQSGPNQSHDHSTYTLPSKENSMNHTYTVPKEVPSTSKEMTMSADSLNASPLKIKQDVQSPIDDKTYTKADEEKDSNCERLSQISPYLVSPTTDTSAPDNSDLAAGMSTLSKPTVPTDAKSSKPSETQCLSKATSIDSWCSNDTLYNVEENFDDLAMDPDILDYELEFEKDKSESEDTLTHNEDEKEHSHCSTYIVHDSKSDACDTFSPDSITANDNYTYTKAKTEIIATTPSLITKSDLNDSNDTKNTQTKDLAYGTLMSGMPSYSNCTELVSGTDETWKLPQPELVRRSPMSSEINFTPPRKDDDKNVSEIESPKFTSEHVLKKMDSVEISCLKDNVMETKFESPECLAENVSDEINESLNRHFRNMALSVTSTPVLETNENIEPTPMHLPQNNSDDSSGINNVPNFNVFFQSAEIRPQDISSNINEERVSTEVLLEGDSETLSRESKKDATEKTPTYSDFEFSAITKPQDANSKEKSSQSVESGVSSEEFKQFQNSAVNCPQDLSSLIDASSLLLKSERKYSERALSNLTNIDFDFTNQSENCMINNESESLTLNTPSYTNLIESQNSNHKPMNIFITDIDLEDETEQPHSIIITESPLVASKLTPNRTYDSHIRANLKELNTFDTQNTILQPINVWNNENSRAEYLNGMEVHSTENIKDETSNDLKSSNFLSSEQQCEQSKQTTDITNDSEDRNEKTKISPENIAVTKPNKATCNGTNEVFATINVINETFEELVESNVDDNDTTTLETIKNEQTKSDKSIDFQADGFESLNSFMEDTVNESSHDSHNENVTNINGADEDKVVSVTDDFLQNEKKFCQLDSFFPLLSDIRFTGPATEIMSTSFTQDSPTEPTSPECEQDSKPDPSADILKEWDSDTDSHSTNSSSGEFIWKDGDGQETALVPSTQFDHQRDSGSQPSRTEEAPGGDDPSSGSGDSGSGSEGDEVEFVPSSWDCRAAPSKSSLRSLEQPTLTQDTKKRVVFKRQKYHCVYEYPREAVDVDSPAYLPDFSTYSDWDATSAEEAEIGYGQLFGAPNPLDMFPLRSGIAFGADYDEDFFISSSARPFESLGVMSSSSQFFPGLHAKAALHERDFPDPLSPLAPPLPAPLSTPLATPTATPLPLLHTGTPSLDFTTPDSGVEDITPGSLADDDYKKKLPEAEASAWPGSASSSESASPSGAGEALGGLRHTRDRLKLDLPPSPHTPSPKHNRVFSFVLDKPRRPERAADTPPADAPPADAPPADAPPADAPPADTPLADTPLADTPLSEKPLAAAPLADTPPPPTFSTFGKAQCRPGPERSIVLTDDPAAAHALSEAGRTERADRGEGTVLDSGDEDSGIESSSKATLERNTPDVS